MGLEGDTWSGQRQEGHGGDENRTAGGGHTVSVDKASVGSNQCCKLKCEHPPAKGSPRIGKHKCSLELCLSISFEARFVINRVCQQDYRISHSLPHKTTYMRVTFFCLFLYTPIHPPTQTRPKVKCVRHCCVLH